MSTHGSAVTSWPMRAIGKRGARSSGPTGSRVAGCSGGRNGARKVRADVEPGLGNPVRRKIPTHLVSLLFAPAEVRRGDRMGSRRRLQPGKRGVPGPPWPAKADSRVCNHLECITYR